RAERAVRGGVAVAAHNRHARLSQTQLRADDVNDALTVGANVVERYAELAAVSSESLYLPGRCRVRNRQTTVCRRHIMVNRRERQIGPTDDATRRAQSVERLRRSDFVNEMQVNVEQRRLARRFADDVLVPEFVEESSHKTEDRGQRSEVSSCARRVERSGRDLAFN